MIIDLSSGWHVFQDVHDIGELAAVFADGWDSAHFDAKHATLSEWEPIARLAHLQLLFSETPYWGRSLRYFNEHPWWYRKTIDLDEVTSDHATLAFSNADYFARVWFNGRYVGSHEGYFAPFSFEVGPILRRGANTVVVEVSSPWDAPPADGWDETRFWSVKRNLIKGTYEHADTFIQRDVNPVGLFGHVQLEYHGGVVIAPTPVVSVAVTDDAQSATISVATEINAAIDWPNCNVQVDIRELATGTVVGRSTINVDLARGATKVSLSTELSNPRLWYSWDRGSQPLYIATVGVYSSRGRSPVADVTTQFGIRTVELIRDEEQMVFRVNGQPLFLRGTSYFPDAYLSKLSPGRYRRDLQAMRAAGCNAVRVHVHVEQPSFYSICDELGLLVIQDSDLNWHHPTTAEFRDRAVKLFAEMIQLLHNHPSIISWVGINEPGGGLNGELFSRALGPALLKAAGEIDPHRPIILGSGVRGDANSGDSHNYSGSLDGHETTYLSLHGSDEPMNTEFGFDAPASAESLSQEPVLFQRLAGIAGQIPALQDYQYRLLKYGIESYRMKKYAPCGGYVQFMWIDLCPQSFYGVVDYWGIPKDGLRSFEESSLPVGVFMEHTDQPIALWVVNDTMETLGECRVDWVMASSLGDIVAEGSESTRVGADSAVRVAPLPLNVDSELIYRVDLSLRNAEGGELARNHYEDPFHHPPHPAGHPHRVSNELGMRLYDA